ncbi:MAG: hypothetical protein EBT27_01020 [Betaproteobacteria bacterium]|nr:hypothetical protein [Betaproteobacteria bacterium]
MGIAQIDAPKFALNLTRARQQVEGVAGEELQVLTRAVVGQCAQAVTIVELVVEHQASLVLATLHPRAVRD